MSSVGLKSEFEQVGVTSEFSFDEVFFDDEKNPVSFAETLAAFFNSRLF